MIDLLLARRQLEPASGEEPNATGSPLKPLARVGEQYVLVSRIGRGGMGEVWKAWDPAQQTFAALKFLLNIIDDTDVRRFTREARAVAKLDHPNIPAIYGVDEWNGLHYIAMKFIDGVSLEDMHSKSPLTPRRACEIVRDAALTLDHAHRLGFIHRDIKPANLMLDKSQRVYILDFGLVKNIDSKSVLSMPNTVLGTVPYMSPEQAAGAPVDGRTDIYSLGVVLYELTCGRLPFYHKDLLILIERIQRDAPLHPRKANPSLDTDLGRIILKAMEKDPGRRLQTARELADELGRYLSGEPILTSLVPRPRKKTK